MAKQTVRKKRASGKGKREPARRVHMTPGKRHAVTFDSRIHRNYTWISGLIVVVLLLLIVWGVRSASDRIRQENAAYETQIEVLEDQLAEQEERRAQLEYRSVFITTKQFIEEFAREKLGLIYEDELIFRPEDE